MKKSLFLFLTLLFIFSCKKNQTNQTNHNQTNHNQIIVYSYSSFLGDWGAGPKIAELFTKETGIEVIFIECEDGNQVLAKAILEKENPYADILLGLDNNNFDKAKENNVLESYIPNNFELVDFDLWQELNHFNTKNNQLELQKEEILLTPFDYSHFAFILNTDFNLPEPKNFEDLTNSIYSKKIILMDQRTSTPGMGFAQWVNAVYKDKSDDYMARLEDSVLTVAPSWSSGYGMFTNGEAPLVLSYTTSPAYHVENNEGNQYKALIFEEGHIIQVEGLGLVKDCKNKESAQKFIDFILTKEAQEIILQYQWMFPVNKDVTLPKSFDYAPLPNKILN